MKKDYILSIIIPTKNRERYALKAIEQILELKDDRIQIIVQDNGDTPKLSEMLTRYKNSECLKYNYTEGTLSFVDNFNLAVELADGEYLCIIGDDDGILPHIINVAVWARDNGIEAIKPTLDAVYFWPNSEVIGQAADNGYLILDGSRLTAKVRQPFKEVEKLFARGGQQYLSLNLVKLYHGIVAKRSLDQIKTKTGKYFGGLSPDIYISVALSLTIDKLIEIDVPLTISGICNKSGSADSATGRHTGKLEEAPHFRGHKLYEWSDKVPRFYSVETIWADSALAAAKDLDRMDLVNGFNVSALTTYCLIRYPQYKEIIYRYHYSFFSSSLWANMQIGAVFLKYPALDVLKKVIRRIVRRRSSSYGIEDILQASEAIQQTFAQRGIETNRIINSLDRVIR